MSIHNKIQFFNENLSIKINSLISQELCNKLIKQYEQFSCSNPINVTSERIINEYKEIVFQEEIKSILNNYFGSKYQIFWSSFDVVKSTALEDNYSTLWHLDHGIPKTLKLFIYLNPVSQHGGNTLIIDKERTEKLIHANALPLEQDKRKADLTPILEELNLDTNYIEHNYKTGDALLFNPLLLAHRCLPPDNAQKRYTICFTIIKK